MFKKFFKYGKTFYKVSFNEGIASNTIEISSSDKIEECENSNYLVNSTNDKITNEIVYRLMFENKDQLDSFKKQIEGSKNIKKINVDLV